MIRRSLLWRLYAGYAALVVLLAVIASALVVPGIRRSYEEDAERGLRSESALLAELVRPSLEAAAPGAAAEDLAPRLRELSATTGTRLTVFDASGRTLVDSIESEGPTAPAAEVREALRSGSGRRIRASEALNSKSMFVAIAVKDGDRALGVVRSAVSLDAIDARIDALRVRLAFAAMAALFVALVSGWWLGRRITRPLRQVTAAAQAMRRGEYDRRIRVEADDEVGALASTFNELSAELQQRLEELRRDRNRTLAILKSMTEGVVAVDRSERIVMVNRAAGSILGIDAETSIGRPVWEVVRVTDICELIAETVREVTDQDLPHAGTATVDDHVLELSAATLRNAEGRPAGAVLVMHDVTELRRLELVRRDFVSNVSHELKTPLTAISGFLESILDDPQMPTETRRRFLEKARQQTARLDALVRDLLSLSRAEKAETARARRPLDLRKPLERAADALGPLYERKKVQLTVEVAGEELPVLADDESMRQVFDNLLSNAVRYTDSGGTVTVRALATRSGVVVEVEDTGIGIESRHHERIFERFYRVDTARSRELGGTGLGLSIVKHVVQELGGTISLRSSPGEGSTFRVELPRAEGSP